jgi:Mrp family chromosome partitioning ATPase
MQERGDGDLHMPNKPLALPVSDNHPAPSTSDFGHEAQKTNNANVSVAPAPPAQRTVPRDPLAALQAMSEEEKIALFS